MILNDIIWYTTDIRINVSNVKSILCLICGYISKYVTYCACDEWSIVFALTCYMISDISKMFLSKKSKSFGVLTFLFCKFYNINYSTPYKFLFLMSNNEIKKRMVDCMLNIPIKCFISLAC